MKQYL